MATIINADTSDGLKLTSDTSGEIQLQSAGTTIATVDSTGITMASGKLLASTGPTFRAYMSANFTLPTSVQTKVPLATQQWDTNNNFDHVTNYRFTPTVAGYYAFTGAAFGSVATTGRFGISVYRNGGPASWEFSSGVTSDGGGSVVVSTILYANGSSDYFELYLLQNQGSNATIVNNPANTWFSGSLIRSA
jgi:hypothetical protein